jgi:cytidyltransferase-like protein
MSRIGVVPMSAKPYHIGHDQLIRLAANECDEVIVFVSNGDRKRPGQFTIKGETMQDLWSDYIFKTLPDNVYVQFIDNPVSAVYKLTGDANEDSNNIETYAIYSDPIDMEQNFSPKNISKYMSNLVAKQRIVRRLVPREQTVNISGTQMRTWLLHGNKQKFIAHLPSGLDGEAIWTALCKR